MISRVLQLGPRGCSLSDSSLFAAGSLFTSAYLTDAIGEESDYQQIALTPLREALEAIWNAFPRTSRPNESQTEQDLIWPVLRLLGWQDDLRQQNLTAGGRDDVPDGLLFPNPEAKAEANRRPEEWRRYEFGAAIVESKRWSRPLDRAAGRDETQAPSTQMLRYLRRVDDLTRGKLRWGILTNGERWRLYWAGARSVAEEFLEINLRPILLDPAEGSAGDLFASEADRDHWLRVFAAMFSRDAFLRTGTDNRTFHERARAKAAFYEERVAKNLSNLVFEQVFPDLASAIADAAPSAPIQEVREATLILLYRLLFILFAEDRNLLPVNDRRYDDYALRPLRETVGQRVSGSDVFSRTATRIWGHVADLSRIIDQGEEAIGIPPYNGGLFAAGRSLLDNVSLSDAVMGPALDRLSYDRIGFVQRYINYRDLSVQQLGSIYERLLEYELCRADDGAVEVRLNAFARKNTGSYYTPDELVGLILNETLEPLIEERRDAFEQALLRLQPNDAEDYQRRELAEADPASAILKLRVCDPAMGSGHFLVSLVDTMADHVLEAMAEAASLGAEMGYVSPLATRIEDIRATIIRNARAKRWAIEEAQLDDRHIVRRMILKRCVYGADKNPMAVELAKVALWLHTFTVGAPLSFIDHHLHCGDSLFGYWVRDAIDKAVNLGGELLWNEALRKAQTSAEAMRTIEELTDAEIAEAHRSARMYQDVELLTGELDGFVSFMQALDWLNLSRADRTLVKLWIDGQFGDPIAIARGRAEPVGGRARMEEVDGFRRIWSEARGLIEEERFLNWQIAFPGVWDNWNSADRHGGFDAVIGNPPWDRFEFEEVPWFADREPVIAGLQTKADREEAIAALRLSKPELFDQFEKARTRQELAASMIRSGGNYHLLNGGKLNLYKLFVERGLGLLRAEGLLGFLTPIGIGTDHNVSEFLDAITSSDRLKAFVAFENKRRWLFSDVHSEDQPTMLVVGGEDRRFDRFSYAVKLHQLPSEPTAPQPVSLTKSVLQKVNPTTGTMPIFRSMRDMELVTAIYDRVPVLISGTGRDEQLLYPVKYRQMINMTSRSWQFRTERQLQTTEGAWPVGGGEYESAGGRWLRLFEGKMVSIYNHRYAGVRGSNENVSGQGVPVHSRDDELEDPNFQPKPRYWIRESDAEPDFDWAVGFNDICNTNNARSLISAIVPRGAYGNKLPLITSETGSLHDLFRLQANLASMVTDYIARQKIQSRNLSKYILAQLPIIPPDSYERRFGPKSADEIVKEAVLELTYVSHDMGGVAQQVGWVDQNGNVQPPFAWNSERRSSLRAKLDALYFILYGVYDPADPTQGRDDVRYIYSTFPTVEREETARWSSYRSRDLCLAWINALLAGQPDANIQAS